MDFFEHQDLARRKTGILVTYFALAIAAMITATYFAVVVALSFASGHRTQAQLDLWRPEVLAIVTGATVLVISLGTSYKILLLRGGGEAVAASLGGRRLRPNTTDPDERRLLNIVEEMALASGLPVPPVYLLDDEDSINAFAAGYTPGDAVIGVNRGTLKFLTRDELQGVVAHEFSHILNGDMRLNIRLMGLLNGILVLAMLGYYCMRAGGGARGGKGGGGHVLLIGLAVFVIGYIGLFFARLIKASVSRQREYLADAAAIQFTRNPEGLSGALKKIGGLLRGSRMKTPEAEAASHLFFGNYKPSFLNALSTHPPLEDRIRRIDPQFDGRYPNTKQLAEKRSQAVERKSASTAGTLPTPFGQTELGRSFPLDPVLVLAAIGAPEEQHVNYAHRLLQSLPAELKEAVHDPFSARAVLLAMLLDKNAEIRQKQLTGVDRDLGEPLGREVRRLAPLVREAGPTLRLPLVELLQSTLLQMSAEQYRAFSDCVKDAVAADSKVDVFEFSLLRMLGQRLDRHFLGTRPPGVRFSSRTAVIGEIRNLLSALVHLGHDDPEAARVAYRKAMATLEDDAIEPESREVVSQAGDSLDQLAMASPPIKKQVLRAALVAVASDGRVTVEEAEMLRAIADGLDCPIPPLFAGQKVSL